MRHRINVSITPQCYQELQQICKDYRFANLCEICTALISVFISRVKIAESQYGNKSENNEEIIKQMFAEFENYEPTPQPDIMYRRPRRRDIDTIQYKSYTTNNAADQTDTQIEAGQVEEDCGSDNSFNPSDESDIWDLYY